MFTSTFPIFPVLYYLLVYLAEIKNNLAEIKINLSQMTFYLAQMKFNLARMKFNLAEMKFNLAEMKINLVEMKFNLTLMKLISCFLLSIFVFCHNFKKFYFSNSYNIYSLLVKNDIHMYIYDDPIGALYLDPYYGDLIYIYSTYII